MHLHGTIFLRNAGSQLFGMLVALAIAATLAGLAAPSLDRSVRRWSLTRSAQALLAALHDARSQAALLAKPVALCQMDAPGRCGTAGVRGWLLFVERVASSPVRLDAADDLLQVHELPATVELRSTRSAVTYWPGSRAGTTASFIFCDRRNLLPGQVLIVSQTGRPRLGSRLSDGSLPDCRG